MKETTSSNRPVTAEASEAYTSFSTISTATGGQARMVKLNLVEIKSLSTGNLGTRLKGGCVQNLGTFLMLSSLLCKKSCVIKCKAAQIIGMARKGARGTLLLKWLLLLPLHGAKPAVRPKQWGQCRQWVHITTFLSRHRRTLPLVENGEGDSFWEMQKRQQHTWNIYECQALKPIWFGDLKPGNITSQLSHQQ